MVLEVHWIWREEFGYFDNMLWLYAGDLWVWSQHHTLSLWISFKLFYGKWCDFLGIHRKKVMWKFRNGCWTWMLMFDYLNVHGCSGIILLPLVLELPFVVRVCALWASLLLMVIAMWEVWRNFWFQKAFGRAIPICYGFSSVWLSLSGYSQFGLAFVIYSDHLLLSLLPHEAV